MMKSIILRAQLAVQPPNGSEPVEAVVNHHESKKLKDTGQSSVMPEVSEYSLEQQAVISKVQAIVRGQRVRLQMSMSKEEANSLWYSQIRPVIEEVCVTCTRALMWTCFSHHMLDRTRFLRFSAVATVRCSKAFPAGTGAWTWKST